MCLVAQRRSAPVTPPVGGPGSTRGIAGRGGSDGRWKPDNGMNSGQGGNSTNAAAPDAILTNAQAFQNVVDNIASQDNQTLSQNMTAPNQDRGATLEAFQVGQGYAPANDWGTWKDPAYESWSDEQTKDTPEITPEME